MRRPGKKYDSSELQHIQWAQRQTIETGEQARSFLKHVDQFPSIHGQTVVAKKIELANRMKDLKPGETLDDRPIHERIINIPGIITFQRVKELCPRESPASLRTILCRCHDAGHLEKLGRNAYWNKAGERPRLQEVAETKASELNLHRIRSYPTVESLIVALVQRNMAATLRRIEEAL